MNALNHPTKSADFVGIPVKSSRKKESTHAAESYRFTKRLGSTVYEVNVYLNQDAKETMDDKIMRLIRNEAQMGKAG